MYDFIAESYAVWAEKFRWYYKLFAMILKAYANPSRILDVGTGPGIFIDELKRVFPQAEVLGVDMSKNMCKSSRCLVADAKLLPFKDETFNLVTFVYSLHEIGTPAIYEAKRVLKRNGIIAIRDINPEIPKVLKHVLIEALKNVNRDYSSYIAERINSFPTLKSVSTELGKNFEIKRIGCNIFDFDIIAKKI